jgi:ketosteroid isomerase-like protein
MSPKHLGLITVLVCLNTAHAAEPQSTAGATTAMANLTEEITGMDTKMFDAFNSHDVDGLMSLFTEDLEFYHDKGGLTTAQQTSEGFTKMFGNTPDIKRTLVPGTLQIYPIKDYGAIELGTHRFCHKENGKDDCGNFPFVMIWKKVGDSWKVSRVISYGH